MFSYKTIEETATEWGVTPRHVQYLCREGRIEGAIKRAGVWFIPDDVTSPLKNTKSGDEGFKFVGTKKKLFDSAIKLFAHKGYENVSISDIAASVDIRQSAVYNHFKSKGEILETIYAYYRHLHESYRPTHENLEPLLTDGSVDDFIKKGIHYGFESDVTDQMSDITKLVIQRAGTDEQASEIFKSLCLNERIAFVESGLNKAIEAGTIAPTNTRAVATLAACVRLFSLSLTLGRPEPVGSEEQIKILEDEDELYGQIAQLVCAAQNA